MPLAAAAGPANGAQLPSDGYFKAHDFLHHDESEPMTSAGRSVIASGTQYHVNAQQGIREDVTNVHGPLEEHYDNNVLMDVTILWHDENYFRVRTVGSPASLQGCTAEQLTEVTEIAWDNAPLYLECQTIEQAPTINVASSIHETGAEENESLEQARIEKVEIPSWGKVEARFLTMRLEIVQRDCRDSARQEMSVRA